MLLREIGPQEKNLYTEFLLHYGTHLTQSWEWGEFNRQTSLPVLRLGLFNESSLLATMQTTLHNLPWTDLKVAVISKGPVISGDPEVLLPQIVVGFRDLAKRLDLIVVRIDPNIEVGRAGWISALAANGFKYVDKNHPNQGNLILSLNNPPEDLLELLPSRWKNKISSLQSSGVVVETEDSLSDFLYGFKRNNKRLYSFHPDSYYQQLLSYFGTGDNARVFVARANGKIVAGCIAVVNNQRIYLAHLFQDKSRSPVSNYALFLEVLKFGQNKSCLSLDFWETSDPDAKKAWDLPRLKPSSQFKLAHYIGTYDLPLHASWYKIFRSLYPKAGGILKWLK